MKIEVIETPSLGDRSYLIVDGDRAAAVDPQRDIARITGYLEQASLRLTHVFETHIHNDYVTGGLALARSTDATYVVAADEEVEFEREPARDGDQFEIGEHVVVRAVRTAGHTPHHLSYVVLCDGVEAAVCSGGSMLFGTVGRTDLISDEATDGLTRAQYHSVRHLGSVLPGDAAVLPTHGFGSFCSSASSSDKDDSTIAEERAENVALLVDDEDLFVERLLAGLTAHPSYYEHMAPRNRRGPSSADLSAPHPVTPDEIRQRIDRGEWVVDVRDRAAFASSHLAGSINVELGDSFATYLGWTISWGTPITLVADDAGDIVEAQRQMSRIGIDRPEGAASGGLDSWATGGERRSYRRVRFADLEGRRLDDLVVLDVRRDDEFQEGSIDGAVNIPLDELERRVDELPDDRPIWVHCASGYRASIASSLIDRTRRHVVMIDDDIAEAPGLG